MWPHASGQYMTLDAHHNIHMPLCTVTLDVPVNVGGEVTGPDAAELKAADHVADRHVTGIHQPGQLGARARLTAMRRLMKATWTDGAGAIR